MVESMVKRARSRHFSRPVNVDPSAIKDLEALGSIGVNDLFKNSCTPLTASSSHVPPAEVASIDFQSG